jgi:hypothetical protein
MRSQLQKFGFLVAVIVVVGGVTFLRNSTITKTADTEIPIVGGGGQGNATHPGEDILLTIPDPVVATVRETELHGHGQCDFWFENPYEQPVDVGLRSKSCKCSNIECLPLTQEEAKKFRSEMPAGVTAQVLDASSGILSLLSASAAASAGPGRLLGQKDRWFTLVPGDDKGALVPEKGAGLVRINYEGRAKSPIRLTIKVWGQVHEQPKTRGPDVSLEIPVLVTDPIRVEPAAQNVSYLYPNQDLVTEFYCWSATRAGFSLEAAEKTGDPCFVCETQALTGAEFEHIADILHNAPALHNTSPRTIYHVRITIHERLEGGKQMDLGPFSRDIALKTDQKDCEPLNVSVTGIVRGDVDIGAGEDRDQIKLLTFEAQKGTTQDFPVRIRLPGAKLKVESVFPSYVQVQLVEKASASEGEYNLHLEIPANRANTGKLPADSAVYLQLLTNPPRRVRIPIIGRAALALGTP